jgi:hypothetical protein
MAGNFLVDLWAVHDSSTRYPPDGRDDCALPALAPARAIEDDAPVPKSHKVAVPGNPEDGKALKERVAASLGDRGTITEFLFHEKKNLAVVTIETNEDLSFEEVSRILEDVPLFEVGPINLEKIE